MTRPSFPLQSEWVTQKVKDIILSEKVEKIFQNLAEDERKKAVEDVQNRLAKRFEETQDQKSLELLERRAREVFRLNILTLEQHQNVLRQEAEIRKMETAPNLVPSKEFITRERERIPLRSSPQQYGYDNRAGFPDDAGSNFNSFLGGSDAEINEILNRTKPIIHTQLPSKNYRNNVIDSRRLTKDNLRYSTKALEVLLDEGRDLNDRDLASLKLRNETSNKLSNTAEFVGNAFYESVVKPFTRGIIYDSLAEEGSFYKRNQRERLKYISDAKTKIGVNPLDGVMFLRYLEGVKNSLKNSQSPEDIELYNALGPWIDNKIAEVTKELEKKKENEFDSKIDQSNQAFLKKSQEFIKAEDDAFKWQLLCAITLIAPFAPAVAGIGPVFNVITPLFDVFGPVLFGSQGVATAISNISTAIPGFGHLAQLIRFDYAVEWLLNNTPIVNSILGNEGLVNFVTRSDIMQNFAAGAIEPMMQSPFFLLGPAVLGAMYRGSSDVNHYLDKFSYSEKERENFKKIVDDYTKSRENYVSNLITGDGKTPSVAEQLMILRKNAAVEAAFKTEILSMTAEQLAQFDKYQFDVPSKNDPKQMEKKTLAQLQQDCVLDIEAISKFVLKSPEIANIRRDISAYALALRNNPNAKFSDLSSEEIARNSKQFEIHESIRAVEREADRRGIEVPVATTMQDRISNISAIEKKIIDSDTQKFQTITNSLAPDVKFSPKDYSQPFARANSHSII